MTQHYKLSSSTSDLHQRFQLMDLYPIQHRYKGRAWSPCHWILCQFDEATHVSKNTRCKSSQSMSSNMFLWIPKKAFYTFTPHKLATKLMLRVCMLPDDGETKVLGAGTSKITSQELVVKGKVILYFFSLYVCMLHEKHKWPKPHARAKNQVLVPMWKSCS